jgi:Uma2 family endonuclease
MGAVKVLKPVSLAEYLRSEPDSRQRREYVRGTVRAIARASEQHNRLAGRVYARLLQAEDRGVGRLSAICG